jgi:hypothetical protein
VKARLDRSSTTPMVITSKRASTRSSRTHQYKLLLPTLVLDSLTKLYPETIPSSLVPNATPHDCPRRTRTSPRLAAHTCTLGRGVRGVARAVSVAITGIIPAPTWSSHRGPRMIIIATYTTVLVAQGCIRLLLSRQGYLWATRARWGDSPRGRCSGRAT